MCELAYLVLPSVQGIPGCSIKLTFQVQQSQGTTTTCAPASVNTM
jgi:hypothetical protein